MPLLGRKTFLTRCLWPFTPDMEAYAGAGGWRREAAGAGGSLGQEARRAPVRRSGRLWQLHTVTRSALLCPSERPQALPILPIFHPV